MPFYIADFKCVVKGYELWIMGYGLWIMQHE